MSKIFISYRREDSGGYAGRLYDRLSRHFGKDQVFMDIDHIEPGEDFVELIGQQVGTCKILIALIGRNWVNAADKAGARRLDDPEDFVRVEIASALASNVRVMPVLVGGANMPAAQQLPEQLAMLVRRNAAELSDLRFHQDVDRLIESIEKSIANPSTAKPPIPSKPAGPMDENRPLIQTEQEPKLQEEKQPAREARGPLASQPLQRFKSPLTAIGALLLLAAVGFWYWDAKHRLHYEHYANAIVRWGLPEGIGRLTDTQMQRRNSVLKFTRKGREGPIQEVRIVNSRGQYPPVFASSGFFLLDRLMPLAGNTRVGGYSLPSGLVARRMVFERSRDGRVAQRAYNSSNRLLYALQYVDGNTAKFGDGTFAEAIRESGITHIEFVRANTGVERGLDKEILFKDSSGKPKPDRDGKYGIRYVFDSRSNILQEISLDEKGNPAPSSLGIAKVIHAYDDTWGNRITAKNLSSDNQPVTDSAGVAGLAMSYDAHGNLQQMAFFGKDGRLVTPKSVGAAIRTIAYDDQGNIVENTFRDANQKLVTGILGFARQKVQWDKQGRSTETFFGPDDKPMLIKGRTIMLRGTWDERGNLASAEHFDEHSRPTLDENGCAKFTSLHDDRGNITDQACFDEMGHPVRNTFGWSKVKIASDDRGNPTGMQYFSPEGQPELYEEPFVKVELKYDEQGKKSEEAYLDVANRPVKNKSGYAKVNYEYNTQGKLIQVSFFDENGQPTPRKGGYAKIIRVYDGRGNMAEEILFDPQGNPTTHEEEGYSKSKFKYDDRGHRTERAYFDKNDRLTLQTEGYARIRYKYNDKGRMIEQVFVGLDDSAIAPKRHGYAKRRWTFDERGNISQLAYFGTNDQLVRNPLGYATIRYLYDSLGRETKREFFDVSGAPVRTNVTIDKLEPNSKGLRVKLEAGDLLLGYDGEDVADTRKFYELELVKGERKRELRIERDGKVLGIDVDPGRLTGVETVDRVPLQRRETGV